MTEMTFSISFMGCKQSKFDCLKIITHFYKKKSRCLLAGLPVIKIPFRYNFAAISPAPSMSPGP